MSINRLEQLLTLLRDAPGDSFIRFAIAKEYESRGELDEALTHYRQLEQRDPGYVGLYYHLGKLHERREEWGAALEVYRQGMEVARRQDDRHALGELAAARLDLEDRHEAADE